MSRWVQNPSITCLSSTILVSKCCSIFIRGTIRLFLHMDRLELENRILLKGMKNRDCCKCVLRIFLVERKRLKAKPMGWPSASRLLIFKFTIRS